MNNEQLHELLYQALETEQGGIAVYDTAIKCAINDDLRAEWEEYLEQTRHHGAGRADLFQELGLDASAETPGRAVVRHIGESLVSAMEMALAVGSPRGSPAGCRRMRRQRRDQGSPQLGVDESGREGVGCRRQGALHSL